LEFHHNCSLVFIIQSRRLLQHPRKPLSSPALLTWAS
jgi:hypothetical protein